MPDRASCISLWLDDPKVGCGERVFLVVAEGRAWATLLYVPLLAQIRVPLEQVKRARPVEVPAKKLLRSIRQHKRERKRLGLSYSKPATKAALALLEGGTA